MTDHCPVSTYAEADEVACPRCGCMIIDLDDTFNLRHGSIARTKCPACARRLTIEADWGRGAYVCWDGYVYGSGLGRG